MQIWHCERKVYDNSGNITECILISGSLRRTLPRDQIKSALQSGSLIIDNLTLSADGKLISKENKINDYVEACRTLGIKPLYIEKINNDYVITKVPNSSNIYIPKFATHIRVNQPLNISNDEYLNSYFQTQDRMRDTIQQNGQNLLVLRPLFEKLTEKIEGNSVKLADILTKLDTLGLTDNEKADIRSLLQEVTLGQTAQATTADNVEVLVEPPDLSEINNKLDSIGTKEDDNNNFNTVTGQLNALDAVLADMRNANGVNVPNVDALRSLISENGQKLQDLKTQITPMCSQLVEVYDRVSQQATVDMADLSGYNSTKGIVGSTRVLDRTTCMEPSDYFWDDEDKYNAFAGSSANSNRYILSYEQGEKLAADINLYYGEYAKVFRVLKEFSEDENAAIGGFLEVMSPVTYALNTINNTALAPLTKGAKTVADHTINLTEYVSRRDNARRIRKIFNNVYEMPESLKEFYSISDEDIATYLMERNYFKKEYRKQNTKKWEKLKFRYLLSLITEMYKRENINALSVEEEVRVAVCYITVKKAMCNMSPNFNVKFLSFTVCNDPNLPQDINSHYAFGICEVRNKPLALKVFRHLFYNALLITGFKPSYLDRLLDIFDDVINQGDVLTINRQEWENLEFNMDNN